MEWDEVDQLVDALQDPYAPKYKDSQVKVISEWLKPRDYNTAVRVVEAATSKPGQYPPTKGDLCKVWDDIAQEGTPNAPGQTTTGGIYDQYAVWRQIRIEALGETEYWQYLEDRRHGNDGIWEARWQDEYRRGEPPAPTGRMEI